MNKLKASSNAVKMKHPIIIFAAALVVALPLRAYQLIATVNPESGFYENADFTVPLLYVVAAFAAVAVAVLCFVSKNIPSPEFKVGKNPLLAFMSLLAAGGMVWDIISIESKLVPQMDSYANVDMFRSLFSVYLEENGGMFLVAELVFAVLSVFYFIVFSVSHFEGKPYYKKLKLLALAPLCWSMSVLVSKLTKAISFVKVSELLFEIFMFVFIMLFLLTFARICSGVFTENSMWGIFGYGFAAAFFGALVTVPRLVVLFAGLEPVEGYEFDFSYLSMTLFVLSFIFSAMGIGFKHGLKNIKAVSELELPDDKDVVVKGSDIAYISDFAVEENVSSENSKKNSDTVIESVFEYEIDDALDDFSEEIEAGTIIRKSQSSNNFDIKETTRRSAEETEIFETEIAKQSEKTDCFDEEATEESVAQEKSEFFEATVENVVYENSSSDENFVEFSEMLIEDTGDFEDGDEADNETEIIEAEVSQEESSLKTEKVKKKSEKTEKSKKNRRNEKNGNVEQDETVKVVSLADLKKKPE